MYHSRRNSNSWSLANWGSILLNGSIWKAKSQVAYWKKRFTWMSSQHWYEGWQLSKVTKCLHKFRVYQKISSKINMLDQSRRSQITGRTNHNSTPKDTTGAKRGETRVNRIKNFFCLLLNGQEVVTNCIFRTFTFGFWTTIQKRTHYTMLVWVFIDLSPSNCSVYKLHWTSLEPIVIQCKTNQLKTNSLRKEAVTLFFQLLCSNGAEQKAKLLLVPQFSKCRCLSPHGTLT